MDLSEKFKYYSARECRNLLYPLLNLNPRLTLAELTHFLEFRILEAEGTMYAKGIERVKAVEGRCFQIEYSPERVVWLKIDHVEPLEGYDDIDGRLIGERIVGHGMVFRQLPLNRETDERYSTFFPCDYSEITQEHFATIKNACTSSLN